MNPGRVAVGRGTGVLVYAPLGEVFDPAMDVE